MDFQMLNTEDDADRNYQFFLKHLRGHEKSYVFEYEKDGRHVIMKYGFDPQLHEECEPEPRRKLPSRMKLKDGPPNQIPAVTKHTYWLRQSTSAVERENLTERKLMNEAQKRKMDPDYHHNNNNNVPNIFPTRLESPDPDYHYFLKNVRVLEDCIVFENGDHRLVFEKSSAETDEEEKEQHDDCSSDMEIIEYASLNEGGEDTSALASNKQMKDNISISKTQCMQSSEYRRHIVNVLKKPYDDEEYEKLLLDVEVRKPVQRHLDFRNGRARSLPKDVDGKSYLDYHPGWLDLEIKLNHFGDDKPRRLNLLRGFFFWLQNSVQSGSFMPWLDAECLAMQPNLKKR